MEQSRDKPLDDLTKTKEILRITEITSKIYEIEYKSGRQELSFTDAKRAIQRILSRCWNGYGENWQPRELLLLSGSQI